MDVSWWAHRCGGTLMNMLDLFQLQGKPAMVTGGGRGLGEWIAEALADAGAQVVVCSRKLEACEAVRQTIEAAGGKSLALGCDVTRPEDVQRVVDTTLETYGAIDVLVNNSDATWGAPPEEILLNNFTAV